MAKAVLICNFYVRPKGRTLQSNMFARSLGSPDEEGNCWLAPLPHWASKTLKPMPYPVTPDGRYFVVRGRLWRCTNPALSGETRERLTLELMQARRQKGAAVRTKDRAAVEVARKAVDSAKRKLGERGDVWWADGAPDWNRHLARNTPYAEWFQGIGDE